MIVTPAPGTPGAVPFWRGDGIGRPAELGKAIGAFSREAVNADPKKLAKENDLDKLAAQNLVNYLTEQQAATRVVPSDEAIVIERFRDEIGDWRLCVLSPWGGRVHAAWGLALSAKIRDERDLEADAIWSDDGIVIHLPDADEPPPADLVMIEPDEIEDLVIRELSGSALFGARFRENAARSLLIPRAWPGKRTPLWQQRLKSQSLLEVARDFPRFPVILETYREVMRDVLDLPALKELLRDLHSRRITMVEVETPDRLALRLLAALRLRRHLHVRGRHAERGAPRRRPRPRPRPARRAARPGGAARADRPGGARGGRRAAPAPDRGGPGQGPRRPPADPAPARRPDRRGVRAADRGGLLRRIDAGEAGQGAARGAGQDRGRGALHRRRGRRPLPRRARRAAAGRAARRASWSRSTTPSSRWSAATPRPTCPSRPASSPTATASTRARRSRSWSARATWSAGELLPGGTSREWCEADVLRRLRRASLARLRQEVEATDQRELARFLPSWQNVDAHGRSGAGPDRLREALVSLQGVALTPKTWERDVLPRRLGSYSPTWLDELCTSGELVWVGAGALGRSDGKVALYFREDVRLAGPPPANAKLDPPEGEIHDAIRERLAQGPCFWLDLLELEGSAEELHEALWDLAWSGEVTNDAFAPLRAPRDCAPRSASERGGRRFARRRAAAAGTVLGRWSLTAPLFEGAPSAGPRMRALAELMLERHGIVTRETAIAEGIPGGFASIYGELQNLELLGTAGAATSSRASAAPSSPSPARSSGCAACRGPTGSLQVLAATDPGQPVRGDPLLAEARGPARPARTAGAYVMLRDGEPLLYVERGGKGILRLQKLERRGVRRAPWPSSPRPPSTGLIEKPGDRASRRRAGDRLGHGGGADRGRLPAPAAPPGRLR